MVRAMRSSKRTLLALAACLLSGSLGMGGWAVASGGGDEVKLDPAPINRLDQASIQRGARLFVNYCLSCHNAQFMRYSSLRELGLKDAEIKENLQSTGKKVTDFMTVAIEPADAKSWFGAPPPDLTLVARSRGIDWLYGYLRGFYRDSARPTGWNNLVFPNVGMPHVLWERSGQGTLGVQEFSTLSEAKGEALRISGPTRIKAEHGHGESAPRYMLEHVVLPKSDAENAEKYTRDVSDLVNYLAFMAEPGYLSHRQTGRFAVIILALGVLAAYVIKREYWKDVR
jgi:ubiquinol-cytochrome c reductase cytochrome c1 subunit